jgi:hypothetical protein
MSEVVTAVEVNFSTSGGSHTATVSTSNAQTTCGTQALGSVSGKLGERSTFTKGEIDNLLQDFVLEEESSTKDAYGIKKQYKYIDKLSQILDTWIILSRGSTASPVGDAQQAYTYNGKLYPSTELPNSAFYNKLPPTDMNKTAEGVYIDSNKRIIVLGTTYSVISIMKDQNKKTNEKIFHVYKNKVKVPKLSRGSEYPPIFTDATVKYGYTAQEFFNAVKSIGINIEGLPNFDINLFDVSGTLRSCISSIASFYGYYWYVEKKSIKLISSATANSIQIKDETSSADTSILSATFTKGGRSPRIVASFSGTSNPEDNSGQGSTLNTTPQANRKQFKRILLNKLFETQNNTSLNESELSGLLTFFLSNYSKSSENFDKFIYLLLHFYESFDLSPNYIDKPFKAGTSAKLKTIVGEDNLNLYTKKARKSFIEDDANYYSLMTDPNGDRIMQKPSENSIYSIISLYFKYFSSLFVSNGYALNYKDVLTFTDSSASIFGPFEADTSIKDIEQLSDLASFIASCEIEVPNIKKLANIAGSRTGKIYWLAQIPSSLKKENEDEFAFLNSIELGFTDDKARVFMAINTLVSKTQITKLINNSRKEYENAKKNLKDTIMLAAIRKYDNDDDKQESPDQQDQELPSYELASFSVQSQNVNDFSKSELKSFSGNTEDVALLQKSFQNLIGNAYDLRSSSVTYYKFNIPATIDISIDSISLSVASDGVSTTITKSNKAYMPPDQSLILSEGISTNVTNNSKKMTAGVKNFLKLN